MKRYFYVSDDLDEFEAMENELEEKGIPRGKIHVLSNDDDEVQRHNLNQVYSWFKTDVMHSTYVGVAVGILFAVIVVTIAYFLGLKNHMGWTPFIFLALVLLGFSTWEAGFIGTQIPNREFRQFQSALDSGKHVMQVDCTASEEAIMRDVVKRHAEKVQEAGAQTSTDQWAIVTETKFRQFLDWAP